MFSTNASNSDLNPISHLLALLGAHHIIHESRIRVNSAHCFNLSLGQLLQRAQYGWSVGGGKICL
jgi:hypothetical protein